MSTIDFLHEVFAEFRDDDAIVWRDRTFTYGWLSDAVARCAATFDAAGVGAGAVTALEADFSPTSIAALLALVERGAIVVPLTQTHTVSAEALFEIAQVERRVTIDEHDDVTVRQTGVTADHPFYAELRARAHPGLVLFTSGSTGSPKGAVHDFSKLLQKFRVRRHRLRTMMFLGFDHIGGLDSLLHALSNGSAIAIAPNRSPEAVCKLIEQHRIEVLPTAPSFLSMLLLGDRWREHDLSSLKYITYGAEVMPPALLARCAAAFPHATMLQKYGSTEVGTLRSQSRANDSVWVKLGGEGYETRVVDGMLQIRAASSMLGYLNAEAAFTEDGWFMTGDAVEVDGEYFRILGRKSDMINVGGEKVHPAEVESVLLTVSNVTDATVYGEKHPFLGQIVCARVAVSEPEEPRALEQRIREHCRDRLPQYKIPMRVKVEQAPMHTARFKKSRRT